MKRPKTTLYADPTNVKRNDHSIEAWKSVKMVRSVGNQGSAKEKESSRNRQPINDTIPVKIKKNMKLTNLPV